MVKKKKKKHKPPKSKLPLTWKNYNGLQELDRLTRQKNAKLAPLGCSADFVQWYYDLSRTEQGTWAKSIGWVELATYSISTKWLIDTAYPCVQKVAGN